MAKTRGGSDGGSNMGLIITLVFFVLATLILGVTTYFGFADQEVKEKAKADAVAKEKKREEERNWWRWQANVYRMYMQSPPAGMDVKDLAREKAEFDKGRLAYANGQTNKDEVAKFIKELDRSMAWDATKEDTPRVTYQSRLDDKDKEIEVQKRAADREKKEKDEFKRQAEEARAQLADEKKTFDSALTKANTTHKEELKGVQDQLVSLQTQLQEKGKEKADETVAHADTRKKMAEALDKAKRLDAKVAGLTKDVKESRESLDDTKNRLTAIAEKSNIDLRALDAEQLDQKAREVLKGWTKDWKIVEMDKRGKMPYINLGSADGLKPEVTFSIHAPGLDGKLNPTPKGTMEVVRVVGPHLAQARLTSVREASADPIVRGDRLFNPTWDPNRKRHVALAGLADMGGEGTDSAADFRRLLDRQGVVVDAYIDTKDAKTPRIMGKGITTNTDYLVLAEGMENVGSKRDPYVDSYNRLREDLRAKAAANGVTVIALRKYLDMIGYRAPKVISSNPSGFGR